MSRFFMFQICYDEDRNQIWERIYTDAGRFWDVSLALGKRLGKALEQRGHTVIWTR